MSAMAIWNKSAFYRKQHESFHTGFITGLYFFFFSSIPPPPPQHKQACAWPAEPQMIKPQLWLNCEEAGDLVGGAELLPLACDLISKRLLSRVMAQRLHGRVLFPLFGTCGYKVVLHARRSPISPFYFFLPLSVRILLPPSDAAATVCRAS